MHSAVGNIDLAHFWLSDTIQILVFIINMFILCVGWHVIYQLYQMLTTFNKLKIILKFVVMHSNFSFLTICIQLDWYFDYLQPGSNCDWSVYMTGVNIYSYCILCNKHTRDKGNSLKYNSFTQNLNWRLFLRSF